MRIAMLGMIEGNSHPFSWSAIINGYQPDALADCPAIIAEYLTRQRIEDIGIPGATVTHVWTDRPADALKVARFAKIPHVVNRMEDVLGEVDGVIIATDDGTDHARRARPFIEAGTPIFVDKPLATTAEELRQFSIWHREGARLMSSSGLRYAPELDTLKGQEWHWISGVTCKSIERYAIHALEPIFTLFGPGFESVQCSSTASTHLIQAHHRDNRQATLAVLEDAWQSFATYHAHGPKGPLTIQLRDTYTAFRNQLLAVTQWFRDGIDPFLFAHTEEMMAILIGALTSRDRDGAKVCVTDILETALGSPCLSTHA